MKKIVLTGASGFLGYHIIQALSSDVELYGLYHQKAISNQGIKLIKCDVTNYLALGDLIEDIEPDAIIHTAALADAGFCQTNKELSWVVNVEASANLAGIAADYNIPFLFTSTDMVFDGVKGHYNETDSVNPLNIYGEHKAIAEDKVLSIYPSSLVVRLPLMFGELAAGKANYLSQCISKNKNGEPSNLFYDEYRSICGANSIAKGIINVLGKESGLLHLGGTARMSRYDFGLAAAEAFGLDTTLLKSCSQEDVQFSYQRPKDVSMDSKKAQTLGFEPLTVKDELALIARSI